MTPLFQVIANGSDITGKIADRLLSLTVTDEAGTKSDTVEIRLDNRDQAVATPPHGAEMLVAMGYEETGLVTLGLYTVDETELSGPPDVLVIKGKAADMRAPLKAPVTRSWHQTTLGEIVGSVAGQHGLSPAISPELAGMAIEHVDQTEESDLHLLTRLANQYGAVSKVANGRLVFAKRGEAKSVTGKALTPVSVAGHEVESWRLTQADRGKYGSVSACYHDQATGKKVDLKAGGGDGATYKIRYEYPTKEAAEAGAAAKLGNLKRGTASLSLTLKVGKPAAAAEAPLSVAGIHPDADGAWTIDKVTHTFDASGLSSSIEAQTGEKD